MAPLRLCCLCVTFLLATVATARLNFVSPYSSVLDVNITAGHGLPLAQENLTDALDGLVVATVSCAGLPSTSPYVVWSCAAETGHLGLCSGACVPGILGDPLAQCVSGTYSVLRKCMAGGLRPSPAPAAANLTATTPLGVVVAATPCAGPPSLSPYVVWDCPAGTADGAACSGTCVPGAVAPLGAPFAQCAAGTYTVLRRCMAGGVYNFDDVTVDGSMPSPFLGLVWRGLRVTNSQRYTACNGRNGFKYGVLSGPNVAYSLEIGAAQKNTNYISITVPNTQAKMSVLSFYATAAWEDGLRMDVAAWDASNRQVALQVFTLSFFRPTLIDLRSDPRFSGIYSLSIMTTGGQQVACAAGKQVVIDNLEVYLHTD